MNPPIPDFPAVPPEGSAPWEVSDYQRALALAQARVRELEGALREIASRGCDLSPLYCLPLKQTSGKPVPRCMPCTARAALAGERI